MLNILKKFSINKANKNFNLLLMGRMVSDVGSNVQMLIMPLFILDMGGSAFHVGLFSFFSVVPMLFMYPFGGVLGDRYNRKKIMVSTDLISGVIVLTLCTLSYTNTLSLNTLFIAQVFISLLYGCFDPATKGMVPKLVKKEDLSKSNAKIASARLLSGLFSPVIAISLYTGLGITVLFLINGISFILSALTEMLIKYNHKKAEDTENVPTELKEGFSFIWNNNKIKTLCLFSLVIYAIIQPIFGIVLPILFREELVYTDTQYGIVQVILMVGALVGSIIVGKKSKTTNINKILFSGMTLLRVGICMFTIILIPKVIHTLGNGSWIYFIIFCGVMLLQYLSIMFVSIPIQTIIQDTTPEEYMSRVFSFVGLISKAGMPVGALIYGVILEKIEIHVAMICTMILVFIVSYGFKSIYKKEMEYTEVEL